ncbi:hypothetical protein DAETH_34150 (plasmid) [Deinococcus aetherius]|uniref:Phosphotransferase system EIIC domain-containing protein n=1 Tax=Deinococcus aetherius TaxID=200252 RepID=A0ABM8AI18_9DEIO|nr:hypothetical protein DAETH_34150 [Deinococcus aetherius]
MAGGAGVAALAALVGFLVMNATMSAYLGLGDAARFAELGEGAAGRLRDGAGHTDPPDERVLGGIIMGLLSAFLYIRSKDMRLPAFLGFFARRRFVPIGTAASAIVLGIILTYPWPPVQHDLNAFSNVATQGAPVELTNLAPGQRVAGGTVRLV